MSLMPPREPRLTPAQIAVLTAWIDQGAKAPADEKAQAAAAAASKHWAFQPVVRHAEPAVKDAGLRMRDHPQISEPFGTKLNRWRRFLR